MRSDFQVCKRGTMSGTQFALWASTSGYCHEWATGTTPLKPAGIFPRGVHNIHACYRIGMDCRVDIHRSPCLACGWISSSKGETMSGTQFALRASTSGYCHEWPEAPPPLKHGLPPGIFQCRERTASTTPLAGWEFPARGIQYPCLLFSH